MVYLATDPDREGEAIAWHLKEALGIAEDRARRVLFFEITERAVKEAFNHVGPIDMHKVDAQQARRFLDRFVGYELSRPSLEEGRPPPECRPRPVGRRPPDRRAGEGDQGVRLRGILEDHRRALAPAARKRKPTASPPSSPSGRAPSSRRRTRPTPAAIRDALASSTFKVKSVEESEKLDKADAPFKTSTLQQQAAIRLRFSGKRTMKVAQELYEGIDVGGDGPGRPHHLHANRQPPRLRRGPFGRPRADRPRVRRPVPARQAEPLRRRQDGPGGPRGDPPDRPGALPRGRQGQAVDRPATSSIS